MSSRKRLTWRTLREASESPFLCASSSSSTTIGRYTSCSSKRKIAVGSCINTLVSSTNNRRPERERGFTSRDSPEAAVGPGSETPRCFKCFLSGLDRLEYGVEVERVAELHELLAQVCHVDAAWHVDDHLHGEHRRAGVSRGVAAGRDFRDVDAAGREKPRQSRDDAAL